MSDFILKIMSYGPMDCVRDAFLDQIADQTFEINNKMTIGVRILHKDMTCPNGQRVRVFLWDVTSKTRFDPIRKLYFKGNHGVLLFLDYAQEDSFTRLKSCYKEICTFASNVSFMVLGMDSSLVGAQNTGNDREEIIRWVWDHSGIYYEINSQETPTFFENLMEFIQLILSSQGYQYSMNSMENYVDPLIFWNPLEYIEKLQNDKYFSKWFFTMAQFRRTLPFILEKISTLDTPAIQNFKQWANRELKVKINEYNIIL